MNKKIYQAPTMICVTLENEGAILSASNDLGSVDTGSNRPELGDGATHFVREERPNLWDQGW